MSFLRCCNKHHQFYKIIDKLKNRRTCFSDSLLNGILYNFYCILFYAGYIYFKIMNCCKVSFVIYCICSNLIIMNNETVYFLRVDT